MRMRIKKSHIVPPLLPALLLAGCTNGDIQDLTGIEFEEIPVKQEQLLQEETEKGMIHAGEFGGLDEGKDMEEEIEAVPVMFGEVFQFGEKAELIISGLSSNSEKEGTVTYYVDFGLKVLEQSEDLTSDNLLMMTLGHNGTDQYGAMTLKHTNIYSGYFREEETAESEFARMTYLVSVPADVHHGNGSLQLFVEMNGQVYVLKIR